MKAVERLAGCGQGEAVHDRGLGVEKGVSVGEGWTLEMEHVGGCGGWDVVRCMRKVLGTVAPRGPLSGSNENGIILLN